MERLLDELIESGMLDERSAEWSRSYQARHDVAVDSALLELELVDEDGLLRALAAVSGLEVAAPADLCRVDPALAARLPFRLAKAFGVCPVRLEGAELASLVAGPLSDEVVQELRELFGLQVRQLLVPSHHLKVAQSRLYGKALDPRTQGIEALLERRRQRTDMRLLLERIAAGPGAGRAAAEVLDYVESVLEFCCLVLVRSDALQIVAARGTAVGPGTAMPLPDGSALLAPIRYGGYFLGPLPGGDAERVFYQRFGRAAPAWAFVAPVPGSGGVVAVICADNGPRGIAKRWVAEITLLAARLGQHALSKVAASAPSTGQTEAAPESPPAVPADSPGEAAPPEPTASAPAPESDSEPALRAPPGASVSEARLVLTPAEEAAVQRLKAAAAGAGKPLAAFVDDLLGQSRPAPKETSMLVEEVRGLFEKLATDIPAHLGRGMEAAFRDLVPRMVPVLPVEVPAPRPTPSAAVELVPSQAAPREPTDYRALRAKAKRTKL
jgi:hypothetical protein